MLALVSLLLVGGSLGDLFGRRRMFVIGLCGLRGDLGPLRDRAHRRDAGRRPGAAGDRRRAAGPRLAGDPRRDLRGRGARSGGRAVDGLGGDLDPGRPRRRWPAGRARLALDLLDQPAADRGHDLAHACARSTRARDPEAVHGIDGVGIALSALGLAGPVFALIEQPPTASRRPDRLGPAGRRGDLLRASSSGGSRGRGRRSCRWSCFARTTSAPSTSRPCASTRRSAAPSSSSPCSCSRSPATRAFQAGAATTPVTVLMFILSGRFGALASRIGPRMPMGIGPLIAAVGLAAARPAERGPELPGRRAARRWCSSASGSR